MVAKSKMSIVKNWLIPILFLSLLIFGQCCSSGNKADTKIIKDMNNKSKINSLPQGAVLVSASVVELLEENSKIVGVFQIDTIHGYGPNTPPIGSGSKLNLEVKDDQIPDTEKSDVWEYFKPHSRHKLTLRPFIDRSLMSSKRSWQIIKIQ